MQKAYSSNSINLVIGRTFFLLFLLVHCSVMADSGIKVHDDSGAVISLNKPAKKIISLSPHMTELLFSAGAGKYIVATDTGSDYPASVSDIKKIGKAGQLDYEAILALKPDLIVGWLSGNRKENIARIKKLGFTVYLSEPKKLADIATNIRRLGRLAGSSNIANKAADAFTEKLNKLVRNNANKKPLKVFYILWNKPVMTINQSHIISDVIKLCGGENIFGGLQPYTPIVDLESVIQANPDIILTSTDDNNPPAWLEDWNKWQKITAIKNNHLFWVNSDFIHRQTPRMLVAAEKICHSLDEVRK